MLLLTAKSALHLPQLHFFLRMNGYRLKVDADNSESFLIDRVIKNKAEINEIVDWLEKHMLAA